MSKRLSKKNARIIRHAILTARMSDGLYKAVMIYGMGHDSLWLKPYGRSQPAAIRRRKLLRSIFNV